MNTYPYPTGRALPVTVDHATKKLILLALFLMLALLSFAQSGSGGGALTFRNTTLESGIAGQDGAVYRFPQVTSDLDALVTIKSRSNALVYMVDIDMVTSGFEKAWQPQVGYNNGSAPAAAEWWMEFEMSFVQRTTNTPARVDEFNLSAIDIDGNGHLIREYVSFYGLSSFTLETPSSLVVSGINELVNGNDSLIGMRFDGPTVNFTNIDTSGTSVMTTAKYVNTQKYTVRVGGVASGASGASDRMYSLYFQSFNYNQPQQSTLPVKLRSFNAKLVSNTAVLNWQVELEENFSHYVVEKSVDGKDFGYLTMIFSNENGRNALYSYSENLDKQKAGLVYYRLKMVDKDGSAAYSSVKILKIQRGSQTAQITTYPNPVVSELRITIPADWQDEAVTYAVYSSSTGKMVKHVVNARASQTETINVKDIQAGTYVVKLSSKQGSAVQQIVKYQ